MKVLVDSNIIIDVILQRPNFFADSHAVMLLVESKKVKGYVSASAITDIYYVVRKNLHDKQMAFSAIKRLLEILKVVKVDSKTISCAVDFAWKDFEDAVQYSAAKKNGVKCIITRDTEGFVDSNIPVFSPKDFLALIK